MKHLIPPEETTDKIIVSPFEFAIRKVAEPGTLDKYRPETNQEKTERLTEKFNNFFGNVKIKKDE